MRGIRGGQALIKLRELIAYQVAQEPERHRALVKQLEHSRATRARRKGNKLERK